MPPLILWILAGLFAGPAVSVAGFDEGETALRSSDYRKAYEIWLPIAEAGNYAAQFAIADLLQSAVDPFAELQVDPTWLAAVAGEPADATMLEWLLRAALQGHVGAQARLGCRRHAVGRRRPAESSLVRGLCRH